MIRKNRKLEFRWDNALEFLGDNPENIKIKNIKNESEAILAFSMGGIIDAFELVKIQKGEKIKDIFFRTEKEKMFAKERLDNFFNLEHNLNLYVYSTLFKNKNYICFIKYKNYKIKIYCPIKFDQIDEFKNNWFNKL